MECRFATAVVKLDRSSVKVFGSRARLVCRRPKSGDDAFDLRAMKPKLNKLRSGGNAYSRRAALGSSLLLDRRRGPGL